MGENTGKSGNNGQIFYCITNDLSINIGQITLV